MNPPKIENITQLDDLLSRPSPSVVEAMGRLDGDIIFLGAAGKMGPSLAIMAKRASERAGVKRRVVGVSRFSKPETAAYLEAQGVETIRCDLLDPEAVAALPHVPNVVFMAGFKFGATAQPAFMWAVNTVLPGLVCRHFRGSRMVAFSSGNVYGLVPVAGSGSKEEDVPEPQGEYAMSVLGRERVFQYYSERDATPAVLLRLNYACELRYGVLVDLAQKVWAEQLIDLAMGYLNCIWQGDANAIALESFELAASPAAVLNLAGPEQLSVRELAKAFATRMNKTAHFTGTEGPTALLNNAARALDRSGAPRVSVDQMLDWIAAWVSSGGSSLGKPTHFESRDGKF